MRLVEGYKYDIDGLVFKGWHDPTNEGTEGYNVSDFFNEDDTYRGPDFLGIEPVFEFEVPKLTHKNAEKQIIKELQKTALGDAYHGKALRMAKEIFPLTENELETIEAWETGKYTRDPFTYGMRLQDIAIRLRETTDPSMVKEELKISITSLGNPSIGLFSHTWVIDEVYLDDQKDEASREELRSAFKKAFELLANGPVEVHFSDEPSHDPDSEPSGPGM